MPVANAYSLPKENNSCRQPSVCGQPLAFEKSYWINAVPVSGMDYLRDHRVAGKVIFPAAGFTMAGIAVHQALRVPGDKHKPMALENLKFRRTLSLSDLDTTVLQLSYKPERSEFTVHSGDRDDLDSQTPHAVGMLTDTNPELPDFDSNFDTLFTRCFETIDVSNFYQRLSQSGLDYGPYFKRIVNLRVSRHTGEVVTRLSSHPGLDMQAQSITLLDCAFQSLAAALETDHFNLYVPARIQALRVYADIEPDLWCYARLTNSSKRAVVGDITIFNTDKRVLTDIQGLRCLKIPQSQIRRCKAAVRWWEKPLQQNNSVHQQFSPTKLRN